jgi:hypothetical protein
MIEGAEIFAGIPSRSFLAAKAVSLCFSADF